MLWTVINICVACVSVPAGYEADCAVFLHEAVIEDQTTSAGPRQCVQGSTGNVSFQTLLCLCRAVLIYTLGKISNATVFKMVYLCQDSC